MKQRQSHFFIVLLISLAFFNFVLPFVFNNELSVAGQSTLLPRLKVSSNGRFLVTETNEPFFWLGDTAWQLQRATPQEVTTYLDNRKSRGFTLIQGPTLTGNTDVRGGTNYAGQRNDNPGSPNEAWFTHIDYIVNQAEARGLYIALVVIWGTEASKFSSANQAFTYGQWLGNRYKDKSNVIWIVAGEYLGSGSSSSTLEKWRQLGLGLKNGSQNKHLVTIHGSWGPNDTDKTSATYFHNESWLDFNMAQTGQGGDWVSDGGWNIISKDYNRTPVKPSLDGEPTYEGWWNGTGITWNASGVRKRAYWAVFTGSFGYTYGAHGIWDWHKPGESGTTTGNAWTEAINFEGGSDMVYMKNLMLSRPYATRVPDQSIITAGAGSNESGAWATRDSDGGSTGSYLFVYTPSAGRNFSVNLAKLTGSTVHGWWFNPTNGSVTDLGTFSKSGTRSFTSPSGSDYVLVLDDAAKNYAQPGQVNGGTNPPPNPPPPNPPPSGTGLVIDQALTLDKTSLPATGGTLTGTVRYKNTSTSALTVNNIIIAGRPPGGTNLGGPYYDFSPSSGSITIQPGATYTLTASRSITSSDPTGTWYTFVTYNDSGGWHDTDASQNRSFTVGVTTNQPTGCNADYNNNGTVDIADFQTFGQNYKVNGIQCALDIIGNDCYLNIADFQEFGQAYKVTNLCQ